eukprot:959535-Ditylum_brightwellii.AAC.1
METEIPVPLQESDNAAPDNSTVDQDSPPIIADKVPEPANLPDIHVPASTQQSADHKGDVVAILQK